jgi:5-methylcytosine-specific restriction endonuclease McrA
MDHVIPRSRGGKNGWENCVVACFACNQRKKDHLLSEVDMKLLRKPSKPGIENLYPIRNRKRSWEIFFGNK